MDSRDGVRGDVFGRRAALVSFLGVAAFGGLCARLVSLQVMQGERYRDLAEENRIDVRLLPPLRGKIYDRFGVELATNRQNYRLILIPEQTPSVADTLDRLSAVVPLSERQRARILADAARNRAFVPVTVAENLDWEVFAYLNAHSLDFPGIQPEAGYSRIHQFPEVLSHVIGYVGPVSEQDRGNDPVLQIPGFRVGRDGIEHAFEDRLRGTAGSRHVEINAGGRVIRELKREEGEQGEDVVLTLDLGLQKFAADRVAGESAAVVVMDVDTGDVLTLVSEPGFDSNLFNRGVDSATYRAWLADPYQPLYNKATKGIFPPGSTFKMIVALAGLEAGEIQPNETVYCGGKMELGTDTFHCWRRQGHGWMDMHNAIKQSCDVYFYDIAKRIGIEKIAETANRFGLGDNYDFILPYTKSGTVPTREYKRERFNKAWQQYDTLMTGIGQSYLGVTPLQLAVMSSRLVNGGRFVKPRLVRRVGASDFPAAEAPSLGVDPDHLARIARATDAVVNEARGTALGSRLRGEGLSMGGKTGTAQVRRITMAERQTGILEDDEIPWEQRDHALFCGYGPIEAPRYAISVVVEHGGGGSSAAAPVARDVMREALLRDPSRRPAFNPLARRPGGEQRQG